MTGDDGSDEAVAPRRAVVRTSHPDPSVVAGAVRPDNTAEMSTRVEGGRVLTTVERETTGGLRATVDDYLVNLTVADSIAREHERGDEHERDPTDDTQRDTQP